MLARHRALLAVLICGVAAAPPLGAAEPPGHITGVGGIFVTSPHPQALTKWYHDVLGLRIESWGGAKLPYDAPGHPPILLWNPFPPGTPEMAPSQRDFMINFAVDDLDAFVARLKRHGVAIISRDDHDPFGRFATFMDPDGTKIELWEPKRH